jgi:hypothetical protein
MLSDDYNCVMCNSGIKETCFHLFFKCSFSKNCWDSIPIHWDMRSLKLEPIVGCYFQRNIHDSMLDNLDIQECSDL